MQNIEPQKLDNYISVCLGIKCCVDGLRDYIIGTMQNVHISVVSKITDRCTVNCSRKHGKNFQQWCHVCKAWKSELSKLCSSKKHFNKVNWNDIDTIDFCYSTLDSYEAIAKVFVHDLKSYRNGLFGDFGAVMSLFRNMSSFNVNKNLIERASGHRNCAFAHNHTCCLDTYEKQKCLDSFLDFLSVPCIQQTRSASEAIRCLKELKHSDDIPQSLLKRSDGRTALVAVLDGISLDRSAIVQNVPYMTIQHLNERINLHLERSVATVQHRDTPFLRIINSLRHFPFKKHILILLLIRLILLPLRMDENEKEEIGRLLGEHAQNTLPRGLKKGCLSMYEPGSIHSNYDFYLHVYTIYNDSVIERSWLKTDIENKLATAKGLVLAADMGYGKSSLVSRIICAESTSVWSNIRKQLLAYHFCRHDVSVTQDAATFILNLAASIVAHHQDMGNVIYYDDIAQRYLNDDAGTLCARDPIACFEIILLNPLRMQWKRTRKTFIIIIDALDECETKGKKNLLYFLQTQMSKFPDIFKFIFTSRNVEQVYSKVIGDQIRYMQLNLSSENNINDIERYIEIKSKLTLQEKKKLVKSSHGNFLLVKLFLNSWLTSGANDLNDVPVSLEELYQINFERVFGENNDLFSDFVPFFQVLCASQKPRTAYELMTIANITSTDKERKLDMMIGRELGHFIKLEDNTISFMHKSISDFLTNPKRKHLQFYVDKDNGHKLLTEYFFQTMNMTSTSIRENIIELLYHVAMSKVPEYEKTLLEYISFLLQNKKTSSIELLLIAIIKFNDYYTTELLLSYLEFDVVNETDFYGQSVAFIAAMLGHDKSLASLLDKGADRNFKVQFSYSDEIQRDDVQGIQQSIHDGVSIVEKCKYIYFCGYNILHIAAQYGHKHVVKMLIDRYFDLLISENDMHLNALQLAAENGHLDVVRLILTYNKSMADIHSLYKAAEKGHYRVVEYLLQRGIEDKCLPCNDSFYWLPPLTYRQQQSLKISSIRDTTLFYEKIRFDTNFYDDWRLITCDTALNAAVRNGHLDCVKLLLRFKPNALNCLHFDGKSPLMTAVQYNQSEIFAFLYHHHTFSHNTCSESMYKKNISTSVFYLDRSEDSQLNDISCPPGASVAHLIATYGNYDMMLLLHKNGFKSWEKADKNGASPLHYAFCNDNFKFISFAYLIGLNFSMETLNGSTVFHSSAICRSFSLYFYKFHVGTNTGADKEHLIPDVKDKSNRSILQYSVLLPLKDHYDIKYTNQVDKVWYIFKSCMNSSHDIHHIDGEGRNILHFAAISGDQFGFLHTFQFLNKADAVKLLRQRNKFGNTPFEQIFHSMSRRLSFEPVRIPKGCRISDVFYDHCKTKFETVLSAHEMCMLRVIWFLEEESRFHFYNISKLLSLAITKSRIYPLLMMKVYANVQFEQAVKNNPIIMETLLEYEGPSIAELVLTKENALKCDGSVSPLHQILANKLNAHWNHMNEQFIIKYLGYYSVQTLDDCFDREGYNVLHQASIGGNNLATYLLLRKGLNISKLSMNGESMLSLAIHHSPFFFDGERKFLENTSFSSLIQYISDNKTENIIHLHDPFIQYDSNAELLLETAFSSSKLSNTVELRKKLCTKKINRLCLVHLAAAKGLIAFIKKCHLLFGWKILDCPDYNKITPFYLASIYKQEILISWMQTLPVSKAYPNKEISSFIIYNLLFNYERADDFNWRCLLAYGYMKVGLLQNQVMQCLRTDLHSNDHFVYESIFSRMNTNILYQTTQLLTNFYHTIMISDNLICDSHLQIEYCSSLVAADNIKLRQMKQLKNSVVFLLRKAMKFGNHDQFYIYQKLVKDIFNSTEEYLKSLSLFDIFGPRLRYLNSLRLQKNVHKKWIVHKLLLMENLGKVTFDEFIADEGRLTRLINIRRMYPSYQKLFDHVAQRIEKESDEYKKQHKEELELCESCDIEESLEAIQICSVGDMLFLIYACQERHRGKRVNTLTDSDILKTQRRQFKHFKEKSQNSQSFKRKFEVYLRKTSLISYFMQFIPEKMKKSYCMRSFIIHTKIVEELINEMNLKEKMKNNW